MPTERKSVQTYLTDEMYELLEHITTQTGLTKSMIVSMALRDYALKYFEQREILKKNLENANL